jgi:iron(III) transport system substrate-binding protein
MSVKEFTGVFVSGLLLFALLLIGPSGRLGQREIGVGVNVEAAQDATYEAAKKEGKMVWYISQFDVDTAEQVAKAFEQKYPGIKVDVVRATGGVTWQRVLQETRAGVYKNDIYQGADEGHYPVLMEKDLLMSYVPAEANKLLPFVQKMNPEGYYHIGSIGLMVIIYNTQKVSREAAPKSWKDLLDPKWKGQIAIGHPAFSNYKAAHVLQLTKMYGWEYWEQLAKQNPKVGRSIIDANTALNIGERLVGISADFVTLKHKAKGNPVDFVYPQDGVLIMKAPVAIMKRAPHPNAARLFMDFTTSAEYSEVLTRNFAYPLRPDVKPAAGTKPLSELKLLRPSLQEMQTEIPKLIEKFRSTFGV